MPKDYLQPHYGVLTSRALRNGSFALRANGSGRADATAWGVLSLRAAGKAGELITPGCRFLQKKQLADGRVPVDAQHAPAAWPTALAIMAWKGQAEYAGSQKAAVEFLLSHKGRHARKSSQKAVKHNTGLIGWPWIQGTYSWVAPTAIAVIALRVAGFQDNPRVSQALAMLMDRQLDTGGWNYGNTMVFGARLRPMPDTTGLALIAVQGLVEPKQIKASVDYLSQQVARTRTPISLGWGLMGLAAWDQTPAESTAYIQQTLDRQAKLGTFDTGSLSTLLVAAQSPQGLLAMLGA